MGTFLIIVRAKISMEISHLSHNFICNTVYKNVKFFVYFFIFETGFHYIAVTVLELTL